VKASDRAGHGVEVAPGVFRLGSRRVNWYAVHDGATVVLIDAGLPGHLEQLRRHLAYTGRRFDDIRAVGLTHAHSDHIGLLQPLSRLAPAPVYVGDRDVSLATGARRAESERPMRRQLLHPALLLFYRELVRAGIRDVQPADRVVSLSDDAEWFALIRPVSVPGHTAGSTAFSLSSRQVVFTGDALVTLNCVTGATGPTLMPAVFSEDTAESNAALSRLDHLPADLTVLPGHGAPWTDGLADAVARARAR
jgi:glyoxylase-like metal-dependent hydrolase (beta-lactamase superfamily II)